MQRTEPSTTEFNFGRNSWGKSDTIRAAGFGRSFTLRVAVLDVHLYYAEDAFASTDYRESHTNTCTDAIRWEGVEICVSIYQLLFETAYHGQRVVADC